MSKSSLILSNPISLLAMMDHSQLCPELYLLSKFYATTSSTRLLSITSSLPLLYHILIPAILYHLLSILHHHHTLTLVLILLLTTCVMYLLHSITMTMFYIKSVLCPLSYMSFVICCLCSFCCFMLVVYKGVNEAVTACLRRFILRWIA